MDLETIGVVVSLRLVGSPFSGVSRGSPTRRPRPPVEGIKDAELVSTGLHGIQISDFVWDEDDILIEVSLQELF